MNQSADEFMEAYERATDGHELEMTLALIDEAAVYLFSDESVHVGKAAISSVLARNFELIQDESYAMDNLTWLVKTDEAAACVYDYRWSGTIRGQFASGAGRGTTVLKRADGEWKVVHEHLSRGRFAA